MTSFSRRLIPPVLLLALGLGLPNSSEAAQAAAKRKPASAAKAGDGVEGKVSTASAFVFSQPNADSEVLGTLPSGRAVRLSKGTVGSGMKFHKVRFGGGIGYIAAIDVQVEGAPSAKSKKSAGSKKGDDPKKKDEPKKPRNPIYFTRFVGGLLGLTEFREDISGVDSKDMLLIYGLKITGPDVLISGPVLDFNLALHYGAPKYYDKLSKSKPAGFVILTDALLLLPFANGMNGAGYFGIGPLISFSRFQVVNEGRTQDLTQINLGVSGSIGGVYRFDKIAVRLEGKYMVEKQSYKAVQASVQTEF